MFIPRQLDKFTNYNSYVVYEKYANRVDHQRLFALIKKLRGIFEHPYIRFMWMGDDDKAMCVIYSDFKSNKRMTKLIPFEEAESEVNKL